MRPVLLAASLYNAGWAAFMIAWPWLAAPPRHPGFWQFTGAGIAGFAALYAVASRDPVRHWRLAALGLASKVGGAPIVLVAALVGEIPRGFWWTPLINDVVWIAPLALIARAGFRERRPSGS
jgi:hypothetical protein